MFAQPSVHPRAKRAVRVNLVATALFGAASSSAMLVKRTISASRPLTSG